MILRLRAGVDRVLERTLLVLMSAMVLNVTWQVFARFILRQPETYSEELARFLLIWTGLLGASLAWRRKMHLSIRLFGTSAAARPRWLEAVTLAAAALFSVLILVVGGLRLVFLTLGLEQTSAALGWPLGYVYLAVPISGALIFFYAVVDFFADTDP